MIRSGPSRHRLSIAVPSDVPSAAEGTAVGDVDQAKACKILEDGEVNGNVLTDAQRRFFGARCTGQPPRRAENGTLIVEGNELLPLMDVLVETPNMRVNDE